MKPLIKAKFNRAFGQYKMPMGVEMMADEVVICNMNNGTVEFVDFNGEEQLCLPSTNPQNGEPRQFKEPSVATVTLENKESKFMFSKLAKKLFTVNINAQDQLHQILSRNNDFGR